MLLTNKNHEIFLSLETNFVNALRNTIKTIIEIHTQRVSANSDHIETVLYEIYIKQITHIFIVREFKKNLDNNRKLLIFLTFHNSLFFFCFLTKLHITA